MMMRAVELGGETTCAPIAFGGGGGGLGGGTTTSQRHLAERRVRDADGAQEALAGLAECFAPRAVRVVVVVRVGDQVGEAAARRGRHALGASHDGGGHAVFNSEWRFSDGASLVAWLVVGQGGGSPVPWRERRARVVVSRLGFDPRPGASDARAPSSSLTSLLIPALARATRARRRRLSPRSRARRRASRARTCARRRARGGRARPTPRAAPGGTSRSGSGGRGSRSATVGRRRRSGRRRRRRRRRRRAAAARAARSRR